MSESAETLIMVTADVVAAHVANNSIAVSDVPTLIGNVHKAFAALGDGAPAAAVDEEEPAVSVRSSVKPAHLICLSCGKPRKMLKRHLMTHHQLTVAEYRTKWNLPATYPMVAPNYAEKRSAIAMKFGLGRKRGTKAKK